MKKRFVSLLLAFVMCLGLCVPTYAVEENAMNPDMPSGMVGVLTTEDGTQYTIAGKLIATAQPLSLTDDFSVTYQYDLPAEPRAGGSKTEYGSDGAYASTVYLTISYSTMDSPPLTAYRLNRVSGYWTISDPKASVESARVSYGCSGRDPSASQLRIQTDEKSVSNNFDKATGFQYYVEDGLGAVLGAHLTVNYLMGTSRRWSFTLDNILFNNT